MKKLQDAYRDANDLAIVLELKPSGAVTDIFLFPFNGKRPRSSFLARTRITRLVEDSELDSIDPKLGIHCFKFALMFFFDVWTDVWCFLQGFNEPWARLSSFLGEKNFL